MISKDTKLIELGPALDITGIKTEYLNKTIRELGEAGLTWNDVDPTGKFIASFNLLDEWLKTVQKAK